MNKKKANFRKVFQSCIIVFFIAILVIQVNMVWVVNSIIQSSNEEYQEGIAKTSSSKITEKLEKLERVSNIVAQNQNMQLYMVKDEGYEKKELFGLLCSDILKSLQYTNDNMYVLAFGLDGKAYEIINTLDDVDKKLINGFYAEEKAKKLKNGIRIYVDRDAVILCKFGDLYAYDLSKVGYNSIGTVCMVSKINTAELKNSFNLTEDVMLELYSDELGERYELISATKTDEKRAEKVIKIQDTQWKLLCSTSENRVPAMYMRIRNYTIIVLFLCIIFLIIITALFRGLFISPINKIFKYLDGYTVGDKKARLLSVGTEELDLLLEHINDMFDLVEKETREIVKTQEELYEKELEVKDVLLYMYQLQVQPHFLYNTLGCINGFAIEHGADEILKITDALSDIFRYSMEERNTVTLGDEVKYTQKYMEIQKMRFPQLVDLRIDVDDELLKASVPKMILQPIVENAFKHGILPTKEKGTIQINAKAEQDSLIISVSDTGAGMTAEKLGVIKKSIKNYRKQKCIDGHIGISNVCKRIFLRYGEEFGIDIKSHEAEGTAVTIKLPLWFDEAEDG